jgi:hypothetical protein
MEEPVRRSTLIIQQAKRTNCGRLNSAGWRQEIISGQTVLARSAYKFGAWTSATAKGSKLGVKKDYGSLSSRYAALMPKQWAVVPLP